MWIKLELLEMNMSDILTKYNNFFKINLKNIVKKNKVKNVILAVISSFLFKNQLTRQRFAIAICFIIIFFGFLFIFIQHKTTSLLHYYVLNTMSNFK